LSSLISPPIRQLVCAFKTYPEGVEGSVQEATSWLTGCLDSLRLLRPVVLASDTSEELFRQAELDLKEGLKLLADRSLADADKADALAQAVSRYYSQLFLLQTEEARRPAFSPILSIDQLIKVAFNLIQERCEVFELQTRFPLALAEIMQLRAQWNVRKALFSDVAWPETIEEHLDQIEGGMGALAQYLEKGEPLLLEEAIQLLGKGSSDYAEQIYRSEAQAREKYRFSKHDAIECWLRLLEHPFDLGEAVTRQAWDRLFQEVDAYQRMLQMSKRGGLSIAQPELVAAAAVVHQHALDQLNFLASHPLPPAEVAERLNSPWDQMDNFRGAVRQALSDLQSQFHSAPRMLELVEILGQCEAGVLPKWLLRDEVEQRMEQQKQSLQALQEAPEVPEGMPPLLASHEQAYQRMLLYCQDEQVPHLIEGWKLLSLTMPPLIAYEAHVRQELSKTGKSGQQVTCIRCGQVQIPQKVCSACGSNLPQMQIDDVRYEDIAGGPGGASVSVADNLVDMVEGLAFGDSTWDQVILEIVGQLETLEKTRRRFEVEGLKMMGKEDSLDVYFQFFVVRMGQLSEALSSLAEAAQNRQLVALKAVLPSYRQLHQELIEFQNRISEGIGKLP
jgi:hypothetical protein